MTFPLSEMLTPGVPLAQIFTVEPMRGMRQKPGELGDLELRMLFVPTVVPHVDDLPLDSPPMEELLAYAASRFVPNDLLVVMREAMVILVGRTVEELKNPHHHTGRHEYAKLHVEAAEEEPTVDRKYDLEADLLAEGVKTRPLRQKYATAVAYALGKFLGLNPSVFDVIEKSHRKFQPSSTIKGNFAAAVLGVLGLPEIALGGIRSFLRDRLKEEMIRLINAAKAKRRWFSALQDISRGRGCASSCVDAASEIVAFADSFSTASALLRLKAGKGAGEVDECVEMESVIRDAKDKIVKAAFQNLQRLIWPVKEESFDELRKLTEGNRPAEAALWGWEARAELNMILSGDRTSLRAMHGLISMEELKYKLELKGKDLELKGLKRLLAGDKGALKLAKAMTPDMVEKILEFWKSQNLFGKVRLVFFMAFAGLIFFMWFIKKTGLSRTFLGGGLQMVLDLVMVVAVCALLGLVGASFILAGKPFRDKVKGPDPEGIIKLGTFCDAALDKEAGDKGMLALQTMLIGLEPSPEGKQFLKRECAKYNKQCPEAGEALQTLEYMYVLQQAGKSAQDLADYDVPREWPTVDEIYGLWPYDKFKTQELINKTREKLMAFLGKARIHPWMKLWAVHSGDKSELFQKVACNSLPCNSLALNVS